MFLHWTTADENVRPCSGCPALSSVPGLFPALPLLSNLFYSTAVGIRHRKRDMEGAIRHRRRKMRAAGGPWGRAGGTGTSSGLCAEISPGFLSSCSLCCPFPAEHTPPCKCPPVIVYCLASDKEIFLSSLATVSPQ